MGINFKVKRVTTLDTMLKGKEDQEESGEDRIEEKYSDKEKLTYKATFQVGEELFDEDIQASCMAEAHYIIYKNYPEAAKINLTEKE